jgi:hypothetical protein
MSRPGANLAVNLPIPIASDTYCSVLKQPATEKETNGFALFPGQVSKSQLPAMVTRKDIDLAFTQSPYQGAVTLTLITCIDYTLTFDSKTHHQTGQAYAMGWSDPNRQGPIKGAFFPDRQYDHVVLMLQPGGIGN